MALLQSALLVVIMLLSFPLGRWISSMTVNEVQAWQQEIAVVQHVFIVILLASLASAVSPAILLKMAWWQALCLILAAAAGAWFLVSTEKKQLFAAAMIVSGGAIIAVSGTTIIGWTASIGFLTGLLTGSRSIVRE
ncbi:hypothetical protein HYU19_02865 [Candidatus Woesearchaeota archaeon]|nr:hypothetical protein [Candidatus Woesearchaeota archaeon]